VGDMPTREVFCDLENFVGLKITRSFFCSGWPGMPAEDFLLSSKDSGSRRTTRKLLTMGIAIIDNAPARLNLARLLFVSP
jgi:hypothetical protein